MVKASDLKSDSLWERRFEPYRLRDMFLNIEVNLLNEYFLVELDDRNAVVAEWLRRLTRNQIHSGSVGSNPTDCEIFSYVE